MEFAKKVMIQTQYAFNIFYIFSLNSWGNASEITSLLHDMFFEPMFLDSQCKIKCLEQYDLCNCEVQPIF